MALKPFISDESAKQLMAYQGPIPGQSLTNSTDVAYAWEQPPRFSNRREAEIFILEELTGKEAFVQITDMLAAGTPVESIARTYLLSGYGRGLWNVDMILLLAESVGFMIMALAEKAGIKYELYAGESKEINEERQSEIVSKAKEVMTNQIRSVKADDLRKPKSVSPELNEAIENIDVNSLLSPDEEEE